jgi:hypothetical protein
VDLRREFLRRLRRGPQRKTTRRQTCCETGCAPDGSVGTSSQRRSTGFVTL